MEKMKYVQPEIEVLTIKIEQGFAVTGDDGNQTPSGWGDM